MTWESAKAKSEGVNGYPSFSTQNNGFFNLRNQDVCRDDPMRQRKFFNVEVTEEANGNWQTVTGNALFLTCALSCVPGVASEPGR